MKKKRREYRTESRQVDMSLDRQNKHVWEKSEGGIGSTKFCRSEQHISKVEYSSSFCALMSCFQLVKLIPVSLTD